MPVYKDKQRGTWYISTSYTPKKGFYKKKTVRGFKKKSDALNYERVIMIQLKQKAKYNFVLGLKLEDVWKEYSDYMRLTEWKDSTYNANSCIYKKHIKPYFLGRDLLQIQKKEITEWHTALVKKGLSKPSINVIHTAFSGIYTYANVMVADKWIEYKPIYDYVVHDICNTCGFDLTANGVDGASHAKQHMLNGEPGGHHSETVQIEVGKEEIVHEAVYEKKWVVDKPAWDEKVSIGFKCECGKWK